MRQVLFFGNKGILSKFSVEMFTREPVMIGMRVDLVGREGESLVPWDDQHNFRDYCPGEYENGGQIRCSQGIRLT